MKIIRIVARVLLIALVSANLLLIFLNSAMVASDSGRISAGFTNSIAPLIVRNYNDKTTPERNAIVEKLDNTVREFAHSAEFMSLGFLLLFLVRNLSCEKRKLRLPAQLLIVSGFCMIYALSDEIHQLYVDGRSFELLDIGMDTAGAIFGQLAACIVIAITAVAIKGNAKKHASDKRSVCQN